jgi:hypothetical protein
VPTFQGFDTKQLADVQRAHRSAKTILLSIIDMLMSDHGMARFETAFAAFFGLGSKQITSDATSMAMKIINAMLIEIKNDNYIVKYGGDSPGENADMTHIKPDALGLIPTDLQTGLNAQFGLSLRGTPNVIEGVQAIAAAAGASTLDMQLFDEFFKLPFLVKRQQCQVQVYLHELSHHAGGTQDLPMPGKPGESCYEFTGVMKAKELGPRTAVWNAESISMFVMELM